MNILLFLYHSQNQMFLTLVVSPCLLLFCFFLVVFFLGCFLMQHPFSPKLNQIFVFTQLHDRNPPCFAVAGLDFISSKKKKKNNYCTERVVTSISLKRHTNVIWILCGHWTLALNASQKRCSSKSFFSPWDKNQSDLVDSLCFWSRVVRCVTEWEVNSGCVDTCIAELVFPLWRTHFKSKQGVLGRCRTAKTKLKLQHLQA